MQNVKKRSEYMLEQFLMSKQSQVLLNKVQRQAVGNIEGPMLLLASPGSGKTTTMMMRIGYLLTSCKASSERIIAVSFSKASAADMAKRYEQLFPELPKVKFSTIHSLAFDIVRTQVRLEGRSYRMIDGYEAVEDQEQANDSGVTAGEPSISKHYMLRQLFEQYNGTTPKEEQMEELKTYISYLKNKMLPEEQWGEVSCNVRHAADIAKQYEQSKQHGYGELLLDFDDMLVLAERFLRENVQLRHRYQTRYDYVLSDESQDTSLLQHRIINWLVEKHQNLCVVADDDQSIYSWRGAEPEYLLAFKQYYPTATILYMEQNYRSSRNIVETANQFIKRNLQRYPKSMFTENDSSDPITIKLHANVAEEVKELVLQLQNIERLNETAILYRNHSSSLMLIDELNRRGIPFYMKDADERFFKHWIVEDMLNIMRLSYTDRRFDIFEKAIVKLNVYLTKQQIAKLKAMHTNQSIFELLLDETELKSYQLLRIHEVRESVGRLKTLPPKEAIVLIRQQLGYDKQIEEISERFGFQKDGLLQVLSSLEMIAEGLDTLEQFAFRLKELERLQRQARHQRPQQKAVTLSTLHSAKGLEFDNVFMIDLVHGVIPSKQEQGKHELLEEAARLFYVGMTRARYRLELHTVSYWQGAKAKPSLFIDDVQRLLGASSVSNGSSYTTPFNARNSVSEGPVTVIEYAHSHSNGQADREEKVADQVWKELGGLITEANELEAGIEVEHRKFGKGMLESIEQNKLHITFELYGKKSILTSLVLERGMLRKCLTLSRKCLT
ncbi:ATP-dependent helicase [Paenibacillus sp. FSL W7-1287]|uniref:ATP-dependent helicase n=1 Tax=Paenibacillus sp. FSL W7-1287 TaxID=2954538 RepID=UPI0030FBECF3